MSGLKLSIRVSKHGYAKRRVRALPTPNLSHWGKALPAVLPATTGTLKSESGCWHAHRLARRQQGWQHTLSAYELILWILLISSSHGADLCFFSFGMPAVNTMLDAKCFLPKLVSHLTWLKLLCVILKGKILHLVFYCSVNKGKQGCPRHVGSDFHYLLWRKAQGSEVCSSSSQLYQLIYKMGFERSALHNR